ncbi:MAG: hypothetical protein AAFZ87_01860 [Planctomycetota bacterium]
MKKLLVTVLGLGVLAALTLGLNRALAARAAEDGAASSEPGSPLLVRTALVEETGGYAVPRAFTGEIVARRTVDLVFDGSGRVAEFRVDEGDAAQAGAVLATLDTDALEARRAEIESRRERLQAQLDELLAGPRTERVQAARADVDALGEELLLAVAVRDRRDALVASGSIGPEEAETARTTVKRLTATLAAAEARLAELENGTRDEVIAAQRGALGEVDAALRTIGVEIEKTTLRAPFSGTVSARLMDDGAYVSSMAPSPALRLVESGALELRVGLPSRLAREVDLGAEIRATFEGAPLALGPPRLLPVVEQSTRTVTAVFDLDGDAPGAPRAGDLAEITLESRVDQRGAWVPVAALTTSLRGLWSLYAATTPEGERGDRRVIERVEVEVLRTDGARAYVRGTFAGDLEIVTDGTHRVVAGQTVRVHPRAGAER